MKVGVTGAGAMGSDIAYLFSNPNYKVELMDKSEEALKKAKEKHNIAKAQLKGIESCTLYPRKPSAHNRLYPGNFSHGTGGCG